MAETNGTGRWQVWLMAGSISLAVFGAVVGFLLRTSATDYAEATDHADIANLKAESAAQADKIAALRTEQARLATQLTEIETQFCSSDIVRNLMHANDLRLQSVMWAKLGLGALPTDNAYYPMVCNRPAGAVGR